MFKKVIIGGTFDLLHLGHKNLISHSFELGKLVNIGITSDKFNKARGKSTYENQESRIKNLEKFLEEKKLEKRSKIILINNIFGTSLVDPEIQAMVVTKETVNNAEIVNKERVKLGFKKLEIIKLPHAKDKTGKIISSTRIRSGEMYRDLLLKIADQKLDQKILNKFKKPLGKIVKKFKTGDIITVGDIVTQKVFLSKKKVKLSIIDLKTRRNNLINWIPASAGMTMKVKNPPSTISKELILEIEKAIRNAENKQIILVEGEEDLATIPAILLCPFGTLVYYGQPNKGMVGVVVEQQIKEKVLGLLGLG